MAILPPKSGRLLPRGKKELSYEVSCELVQGDNGPELKVELKLGGLKEDKIMAKGKTYFNSVLGLTPTIVASDPKDSDGQVDVEEQEEINDLVADLSEIRKMMPAVKKAIDNFKAGNAKQEDAVAVEEFVSEAKEWLIEFKNEADDVKKQLKEQALKLKDQYIHATTIYSKLQKVLELPVEPSSEDHLSNDFDKAYKKYMKLCDRHKLSEEKADELLKIMDEAVAELKAAIKNAEEEQLEEQFIKKLGEQLYDFEYRRERLPTDCRKYRIIEFLQLTESFPKPGEDGLYGDFSMKVAPRETKTKSFTISTKIPERFFKEWEQPKQSGLGIYESQGDFVSAQIIEGKSSTAIIVELVAVIGLNADDTYGNTNFGANYESTVSFSIVARSRSIIVKVPKDKKLIWEEAQWDYKLEEDEKINKTIKRIDIDKFLEKYNAH